MNFHDEFLVRDHDLSGVDKNYITGDLSGIKLAAILVSSDKNFASGATKPTVKIKVINSESIIAIAAAPTAGGAGYSVGDILTLTEGSFGTVEVMAVTDGVVTAVSLRSGGVNYTVGAGKVTIGGQSNFTPGKPGVNVVTGTGCTIEIIHVANFVEITALLVTVTDKNETNIRVLPDFEAKYIMGAVANNDGSAGNLAIHLLGKK
ncbi:hypothetical protein LCGC14_0593660 [marine sediment metagenome]|uniref:Uncharacterized protein n=1 Tax=marine sediment metagenome TaxID=412755 RepID=A0A0F9TYY2_9ZZZZ